MGTERAIPGKRIATQFCIALDAVVSYDYTGVVKHMLTGDCWEYFSVLDLLNIMQDVLRDQLPCTHRLRTWSRPGLGKERVIPITDKMEIKGEGATFLLHVQYRQNSTWQGTLEWLEGKQRVTFRSTLELIQLMEQVVGAASPGESEWKKSDE